MQNFQKARQMLRSATFGRSKGFLFKLASSLAFLLVSVGGAISVGTQTYIYTDAPAGGIAFSSIPASCASNLLSEGGFENFSGTSGTPISAYPDTSIVAPWSAVDTDGEIWASGSGFNAYEGSNYIELLANINKNPETPWDESTHDRTGYDRIVALVSVNPNTNYTLLFHHRDGGRLVGSYADGGSTLTQIQSMQTTFYVDQKTVTPTNWTEESLSFTTDASTTQIAILLSSTTSSVNASVQIDGINACAPPAPDKDYGDAPDVSAGTGSGNYETLSANNGPSHTITSGLEIGTAPDMDTDGFANGTDANSNATDDDSEGSTDEGSISLGSLSVDDTSYALSSIAVTNTSGSNATLYAWIDFDQNGSFDEDELATATVANGATTANLSWSSLPGIVSGTTYARFRLAANGDLTAGSNGGADEASLGSANSGEVEDYLITVDSSLFDSGTSSGPCVYIHNLDGLPPLYNSTPAYSLNNPVTFNGIHTTDTFTSTGFSGINADASGSGKFLFHNTGDGVGAGGEVFGATSTVLPNTNYRLSFKLANQNTINNAQIQPFINGSSLGSAATAVGTNNWQQFDYIWSSGAATTATFSLTNIITTGLGNDFGIDEISLCALSDYGDAPDTSAGTGTGNYQTLAANGGPQHAIVSGLQIGTAPDSDSDGFANGSDANSNATDDDSEGTADEGSITFGALETGDTNYSLNSIAVTNTTGGNATLFGWIDFDQNGSFDEDERATATVINGTTTANLSWSSLPGIVSGTTYARFRLAASADLTAGSNGGVDEASLGTAASGEVEDYQLTIEVGVNGYKSVKLTNDADGNGSPTPGDTVEYTLHYVNQGTGSVSNFQINDQLPVGLTITAAGAQTVSVSGTGTTAIANLAYTGAAAGAVSDLLAASAAIGVNGVVTVTIPAKIDTGVTGSLNNQASATGTGISTSKLTDNAGQTSDLSVALQAAPFNLTIPASSESQTIAASIDPTVLTIAGAPNVGLVKSCTVPADCTTVAQIPGTELTYQIDFTNNGTLAATGLVIVDAIPDNTDFKLGSATANTGTTGLTFVIEYSSDYVAAPPGAATWTYTPVSAGGGADAGYDRLVKAIRWRVTAGSLSQTSPNNSGSVSFISKIR